MFLDVLDVGQPNVIKKFNPLCLALHQTESNFFVTAFGIISIKGGVLFPYTGHPHFIVGGPFIYPITIFPLLKLSQMQEPDTTF